MNTGNSIAVIGMLLLLSACGDSSDTTQEASSASAADAQHAAATDDSTSAGVDGAEETSAAPAEGEAAVIANIETVLGSADEYTSAFSALQKAVAAGDKIAVARLVDFPLSISVGGQQVVMNSNQFVNDYDRIITPEIATTITTQKLADVLVNTQGVMFGNGQVWLSGRCMDDACEKQLVSISRIQEVSEDDAEFPLIVEVELSDDAAAQLGQDSETVVVGVYYFGFATPAAKDMADDLGMVDLGSASSELAPGEHQAVFDGSQFERDSLQFISGGPRVNINVFSGRHASEDNVLDCDMYEDNLATATSAPITLGCTLLRLE